MDCFEWIATGGDGEGDTTEPKPEKRSQDFEPEPQSHLQARSRHPARERQYSTLIASVKPTDPTPMMPTRSISRSPVLA
jgi:hypothetical protein